MYDLKPLATLLNFHAEPGGERAYGSQMEKLYVNDVRHKGMLAFSMSLPDTMNDYFSHYAHPRDEQPGSILVSAAKSVAVIAKDIERRLFPPFYRVLEEANRRYEREREICAREWAAAKRLADVLATPIPAKMRYSGGLPREEYRHPGHFESDGIECEVRENSEHEIVAELKLGYLPIDLAIELVSQVRDYRRAQKARQARAA